MSTNTVSRNIRKSSVYQDGTYLQRNPNWHVEESLWKATQVMRMVERHHLSPKTVCDVGCGAGEVLLRLQRAMPTECTFWGYEISPQAFELCQARANERLHFRLMDILQVSDAYFDLILFLDVIEHLEDYFAFLRGIKPKSRYKIIHLPLDLSVQAILRRDYLLKKGEQHDLHYFTKETALRLMQDLDYELVDYWLTPRLIDLHSTRLQQALKPLRMLGCAVSPDLTARVLGGFGLLILTK